MTVSLHRTLVALKRPSEVPALVSLTHAIVKSMTGNSSFPSPSPSLAKVAAALADLEAAEVARLTRARGTAAVRNEKRATLVSLLVRLKAHVQGVADDDPENAVSIIESAGMSVKKPTALPKPPFTVKPGPVSGSVLLVVRAVAREASYEWAWSPDQGKTWNPVPRTLQAKTPIKGLPAETTCWFRYRTVTRRERTNWSEPVAFLVR
jgi:hypothetical protein